jgi:hypothetical protein
LRSAFARLGSTPRARSLAATSGHHVNGDGKRPNSRSLHLKGHLRLDASNVVAPSR